MMARTSFLIVFGFLAVAACSEEETPAPPAPPPNSAPSFTSSMGASVAEDSAGTIYMATATDADGDALSFSISGGPDADLFSISSAGALSFDLAPNFESPRDVGRNNVYQVTIEVSDGSATRSIDVNITVTDGPEPYRLTRVATGVDTPLFLRGRPGASDVFVTERDGVIRLLDPVTGVFDPTLYLDISAAVGTIGEGGLLGFAPAPDYVVSGHIYVHFTNLAGDSEIRRYTRDGADPDTADPSSAVTLLSVALPDDNHNGGWIGFGPDGFLYIALGDGGGSGDPFGNGQDTDTLLGAILRIDPTGDDFPGDSMRNYAIPGDNPFVGVAGADEIFAFGLRNPYRSSFDRATGDLYIGDVGQGDIEEVDFVGAGDLSGRNFGWPLREGTTMEQGADSAAFTAPVLEYGHGGGPREGRSLTGGYVYRGPLSALTGRYFFADFISDNVWSVPVSDIVQGQTVSSDDFILETDVLDPDAGTLFNIVSFGEDNDGNLYILTLGGEIFQIVAM